AIVEIVAVDRGHDNVVEAKRGDRFADALRLVRVELIGAAGRDIAEGAGAGANRAQNHHRRVLFLPALADIRAGRLFADCVELQLAHQAAGCLVFRRGRRLDAYPGRLPRARLVRPRRLLRMPQRLRRGLCLDVRQGHRSEVEGAAIGVKHGLVHRLGDRRVREDGPHQLALGGLQGLGDRVALDQLGNLGADHMRAEQFAGLGVEHRLDHALGLAERDRLAVADEREMPDLDLVAGVARRLFGQPDARHLRPAIGAGRDVARVERVHVVEPGDVLDANDALMHRLVRQPGRPDEIPDRVKARLPGAQPFIDDDMGALDFRLGAFEADILDIADDADREDDALDRNVGALAAGLDLRRDAAIAALQVFHGRAGMDLDALFLEALAGESGDLFVLDRQDAVEYFDDRHLGAHVAVEAGE